MPVKQHTINKAVTVSGIGLHTGASATMTFNPAPANHGFVFCRTDLEGQPRIAADVDNVVDTSRGTTIEENGARIHTVEHTLAALAGLQLDNILIELDGPEPPIMDGSAREFCDALAEAGYKEQAEDREYFEINELIHYQEQDRQVELAALPAESFHITVMIDFGSKILKAQHASLNHFGDFRRDIAPCRTFCFFRELEELYKSGLIQGGTLDSAIVVVDHDVKQEEIDRLSEIFGRQLQEAKEGILNNVELHFDNEPARHKLLDLIGDLALVGVPLKGHIMAARPGHKANVELAKKIKAKIKQNRIQSKFQKTAKKGVIFDINAIHDILPHRYPFLLVDKIVDFSEQKITGIKNVTNNEPFFQGHFPGNPIMPGVLQLEAMAQVGGILLLNTIDNPESVWVYIVGIDNARFKKPVVPGDTMVLEVELVALRRGICKMRGKALVDGQVVCSADMVAGIVPKENE